MKIALYIEDGLEQIVLTGETETERSILAKLSDETRDLSIKHGSFYACQGGWVRHQQIFPRSQWDDKRDNKDQSTMLVLTPKPPVVADPEPGVWGDMQP